MKHCQHSTRRVHRSLSAYFRRAGLDTQIGRCVRLLSVARKHESLSNAYCTRDFTDRSTPVLEGRLLTRKIPKSINEEDSILRFADEFFVTSQKRTCFPNAAFTAAQALPSSAIVVEIGIAHRPANRGYAQVSLGQGLSLPARRYRTGSLLWAATGRLPKLVAAFRPVVICRWPIHVFALDPVVDEQEHRRPVQPPPRVAGEAPWRFAYLKAIIHPDCAMQFMAHVELDLETIALNRTIVGFSHGDDTFGWPFYPRLQSPPIPGNGRAFIQTITGPSVRTRTFDNRQLEPGIRECEAIVIMPSIPFPTSLSIPEPNSFCLAHPQQLELTMHDTMKLSRMYQAVHRELPCVRDSHNYRSGGIARMTRSSINSTGSCLYKPDGPSSL